MNMNYTFTRQRIYELLIDSKKPLTRDEIVKKLKISRSTVYDHLVVLMHEGKVLKKELPNRRRSKGFTRYNKKHYERQGKRIKRKVSRSFYDSGRFPIGFYANPQYKENQTNEE